MDIVSKRLLPPLSIVSFKGLKTIRTPLRGRLPKDPRQRVLMRTRTAEPLQDWSAIIDEVFSYHIFGQEPGWPEGQGHPHERAWRMLENTAISPLVFSTWFRGWDINEEDLDAIKAVLKSPLSGGDIEELGGAIHSLLIELAFPEINSHWKLLAKQLVEIRDAGRVFLKLADPPMGLGRMVVLLPASVTVVAALQSKTSLRKQYRGAVSGVAAVVANCERALDELNPKISTRGKKGDLGLQKFMQRIVVLAGSNLALPSNEDVTSGKSRRQTPLVLFSKAVIKIVVREGKKAVEGSALQKAQKKTALRAIRELSNKSDGALIEQLRKAKKSVASRR